MAATTIDYSLPFLPGSFMSDHDHRAGHVASSPQSYFFRPPPFKSTMSPSPSSSSSRISRPNTLSTHRNGSFGRKRPRRGSTQDKQSSLFNTGLGACIDGAQTPSSTYRFDIPSPPPLVNTQYRLADGGLNATLQGASIDREQEELAQRDAERDWRVNRYTASAQPQTQTLEHTALQTPNTKASRKRSYESREAPSQPLVSNSISGWHIRSTAWALTGGLAGKVFTFCLNSAIRGFSAGGGSAYRFDGTLVEDDVGTPDVVMGGGLLSVADADHRRTSAYSYDDYNELTPSKESMLDNGSALKSSWVMVDSVRNCEDNLNNGEARSPARKKSRASVAGASHRRSGSNNSISGIGLVRTNSSSSASYASPRARGATSTTTNSYRSSLTGPTRTNISSASITSPQKRHTGSRSSTNFASPTSNHRHSSSLTTSAQTSSLSTTQPEQSPEVLNYKRKMRKLQNRQDEDLERLNAQLQDMIRQGKEALGSTIEVIDENTGSLGESIHFDEGYFDADDHGSRNERW